VETTVVLTNAELIAALQDEVRILLHLAGKIEPRMLDYRPTPKQRSTLELLKYLTVMGPELVKAAVAANFDPASWTAAEQAASARDFEQTLAALAAQSDWYASTLGALSDAQLREEIVMFDERLSRGSCLVRWVLSGCAAYRTQLFLYLKACGREELTTMNLWAGIDEAAPA
jgi:hypothetical protein